LADLNPFVCPIVHAPDEVVM